MSNTPSPHCKYFVQRKKRYCKMLVKTGQEFCGEHQKPLNIIDLEQTNSPSIRILCPLDRKHTVYAHSLAKHLKICNARPKDAEPYIKKGINAGLSEDSSEFNETSIETHQMLSQFPKDKVLTVIEKINRIYEAHVQITSQDLSFPTVEEELKKPEYGDKTKKHLKQASSILGLLKEYGMLQDKTCYIEFGAGRGQLSCWVAEATEALQNCKLLLVERASPKHKRDNKLARTSDRIQRIRADIADLVLDKLEVIGDTQHIVGITKHLCGEATDLAIRCLTNPEVNKEKIFGAVLTFCCHHRCRWTPFVGKKFFEDNELNKDDFSIMRGISSWATCGSGFSREYRDKLKNDGDNIEVEKSSEYGLTRAEREAVGRRCKNVMNWGRLKYMEQKGFTCALHNYVEKDVTLENICLVMVKPQTK